MAENKNATEGTYSSAPFITKDGVDANGVRAEVKVVMGYGDVVKITDSSEGKTKNIEFAVRNTKYNPTGWCRDAKIQKILEKAQESGEPVHFRIETRRKIGIDRNLPIAEISTLEKAKDSIVKSLAAVRLEGEDEWTLGQDAVSRIDEDPTTGLVSANLQTKEQLQSGRDSGSGNPTNSRRGDFEPAPYVAVWKGEINPGSIAVAIPINFLTALLEYERSSGIEIEKDRRKEIAIDLLKIANRLQKDIYVKKMGVAYGGVDLTAGSHTRARALIFEAMRSFFPLTESILKNEEEYATWKKSIFNVAYSMWSWGLDAVDEFIQ